jgi:hypothetical protein
MRIFELGTVQLDTCLRQLLKRRGIATKGALAMNVTGADRH